MLISKPSDLHLVSRLYSLLGLTSSILWSQRSSYKTWFTQTREGEITPAPSNPRNRGGFQIQIGRDPESDPIVWMASSKRDFFIESCGVRRSCEQPDFIFLDPGARARSVSRESVMEQHVFIYMPKKRTK